MALEQLPLEDLKNVQKELGLKYKVPALYNPKTGEKLNISELEYEDINVLIASGAATLDPEADVDYVDSLGKLYSGKGKDALEMITNNIIIDTPTRKTLRDVEKILGTPISLAQQAAMGAASGATGGLSKPALKALGVASESMQRAMEAANPLLHLTAEITGVFTPFGLEAIGAKAAEKTAMSTIGKVAGFSPVVLAEKAGKAIESSILSDQVAAGLLSKAGARIAGGAVDGALGMGTFELSEQMLDGQFSAEHLVGSMSLGALLGGGIGAGTAGLEHGISSASKRIKKMFDLSNDSIIDAVAKGTNTDASVLREYLELKKQNKHIDDLGLPDDVTSGYKDFLGKAMDDLANGKSTMAEAERLVKDKYDEMLSSLEGKVSDIDEAILSLKDEIKLATAKAEDQIKANLETGTEKLAERLDDLKNSAFDESLIRDEWLSGKKIDVKEFIRKVEEVSQERFNRRLLDGSEGLSEEQKAAFSMLWDTVEQTKGMAKIRGGYIDAKDFRQNIIKQLDLRIGNMNLNRGFKSEGYETSAALRKKMSDALHTSLGAEYEKILKPIRLKAEAQDAFKKALGAKNLDPLTIMKKLLDIEKKDIPLHKQTILDSVDKVEKTYFDSLKAAYDVANNAGDKVQAKALKEVMDEAKNWSIKNMIADAFDARAEIKKFDDKIFDLISDKSLKGAKAEKRATKEEIKKIKDNLRRKIYDLGSDQATFEEITYHNAEVLNKSIRDSYKNLIGSNGKIISPSEFNSLFNAALKGDSFALKRIKSIGDTIKDIDPSLHKRLTEIGKNLGFKDGFDLSKYVELSRIKSHLERGGKTSGVNNIIFGSVLGATIGGFGGGLTGALLTKLFDKSGPQFAKSLIDYYTKLSGIEKIGAHGSSIVANKIDTFFGLESGKRIYGISSRMKYLLKNEHESDKMTIKKYEEIRDQIERYSINQEAYVSLIDGTMQDLSQLPGVKGKILEQSIKNLKFLDQMLPKSPRPEIDMLKKRKWSPSDAELGKFKRYYDAVNNPYSVLDSLNDGTITNEEINTLKAVYPSIYNESIEHITNNLIELGGKGLTYDKRIALSRFLGKPLDESLEAGFIIDLQSLHAMSNAVQSNQDASQIRSEAANRRMTDTQKSLTRA